MIRAERIIVGIDFSQNAIEVFKALNFLELEESGKIFLLHVVPDLDAQASTYLKDGGTEQIQKKMEALAAERLKEFAEKKLKVKNPWEIVIAKGEPANVVLRFARERVASLVILGNSDIGKAAGTRFGSTADKVVRGATCPVLIVPLRGI